jgi:hypothetical protein
VTIVSRGSGFINGGPAGLAIGLPGPDDILGALLGDVMGVFELEEDSVEIVEGDNP